jgi:hypothetical protein
VQEKDVVCLSKRYVRKDRLGKAKRAGVQLLKQGSNAYKVKEEIA